MNQIRYPWEDVAEEHTTNPLETNSLHSKTDAIAPRNTKRGEGKSPNSYSLEIKLQVTLDSLKGTLSQREIGVKYGVPQPLVSVWKSNAIRCIRENLENQSGAKHKKATPPSPLDHLMAATDIRSLQRLSNSLRETVELLEHASGTMAGHIGNEPKE